MNDNTQFTDYEHLFQKRLKALRKEFGYSFAKLEELTGISRSTLQRYETKSDADIPLGQIKKIATAFHVSIAYLIGMTGRNITFDDISSFFPLLKELGYSIEYEADDDIYFLVENDERSFPITTEQIIDLKNTTISYIKFKLNEIMYPQK